MTSILDSNSSVSDSTAIDDTDSPYTTQGENVIEVDTTTAAVTVTLASADAADAGRLLRVLDVGDNAQTNTITVNTEGAETIDPGGASSETITTDGGSIIFEADGTDWYVVGGSASGSAYIPAEVSSDYTTQGENVILANTSSSTVNVTLASADLALDHPITVINLDGSNAVTVNTEGSETIDPNAEASKSITKAGWGVPFTPDGTNWDSGLSAEYETVTTEQVTINGLTAVLQRTTTNQSISQDTDTTVDWNTQDVDTGIYSYNTSNDELDVLVAGDYRIDVIIPWNAFSDQDALGVKILLNSTVVQQNFIRASGNGATQSVAIAHIFKDLPVNGTIRVDVRTNSTGGASIEVSGDNTPAAYIQRLG